MTPNHSLVSFPPNRVSFNRQKAPAEILLATNYPYSGPKHKNNTQTMYTTFLSLILKRMHLIIVEIEMNFYENFVNI